MTPVEIGIAVGAGGGLIGHIARNHGIEPPSRLEKPSPPGLDLGVIRDIMLGAGGGVVFVEGAASPPTVLALFGGFIAVLWAASQSIKSKPPG